jgi:hypothetical protein
VTPEVTPENGNEKSKVSHRSAAPSRKRQTTQNPFIGTWPTLRRTTTAVAMKESFVDDPVFNLFDL